MTTSIVHLAGRLPYRHGVLRSRCRRSKPLPSGAIGRKSGPSRSSLIPARVT